MCRSTGSLPQDPYTSPVLPCPSVQYSSLGPRDTPHNYSFSTQAAETNFTTYDVIDDHMPQNTGTGKGVRVNGGMEGDYQELDKDEGGEGVYQVLEEVGNLAYEVPVQIKAIVKPPVVAANMEYSTLQHQ